MDSIGKLVNEMVKNIGIEKMLKENEVLLIWEEIVGERVAKVSQVEKIHQGILFVKVKNDSWRNELLFSRRMITEKINKKLGKKIVNDIRFI